jgi:hypothetical protein
MRRCHPPSGARGRHGERHCGPGALHGPGWRALRPSLRRARGLHGEHRSRQQRRLSLASPAGLARFTPNWAASDTRSQGPGSDRSELDQHCRLSMGGPGRPSAIRSELACVRHMLPELHRHCALRADVRQTHAPEPNRRYSLRAGAASAPFLVELACFPAALASFPGVPVPHGRAAPARARRGAPGCHPCARTTGPSWNCPTSAPDRPSRRAWMRVCSAPTHPGGAVSPCSAKTVLRLGYVTTRGRRGPPPACTPARGCRRGLSSG